MSGRGAPIEIDLTGVPCPVTWARAKVRLEGAARGDRLAFLTDDARSARDIPRAAEAEAYDVVEVEELGTGRWRIVIEK